MVDKYKIDENKLWRELCKEKKPKAYSKEDIIPVCPICGEVWEESSQTSNRGGERYYDHGTYRCTEK